MKVLLYPFVGRTCQKVRLHVEAEIVYGRLSVLGNQQLK